jgi:hypothetical protein
LLSIKSLQSIHEMKKSLVLLCAVWSVLFVACKDAPKSDPDFMNHSGDVGFISLDMAEQGLGKPSSALSSILEKRLRPIFRVTLTAERPATDPFIVVETYGLSDTIEMVTIYSSKYPKYVSVCVDGRVERSNPEEAGKIIGERKSNGRIFVQYLD